MFELCVPARNEGLIIQDVLRRLTKSLDDLNIDWQITVAVNGTTDETFGQVLSTEYGVRGERVLSTEYGVRGKVVAMECPGVGKGAAIKYAARSTGEKRTENGVRSTGESTEYGVRSTIEDVDRTAYSVLCTKGSEESDVFGYIDADLSADSDMLPAMVKMIIENQADIVIGSRLVNTKTTNRSWLRTLSSQIFNLLSRLILDIKVKDAQCGLKVMNNRAKKLLIDCREDGWFLDIEFLALASKAGFRIAEIPIVWIECRYPKRKSQVSMFKDGLRAIIAMLRIKRDEGLYEVNATGYDEQKYGDKQI